MPDKPVFRPTSAELFRKRIAISLSPEEYSWLKELAERYGNSMGGLARQCILFARQHYKEEPGNAE